MLHLPFLLEEVEASALAGMCHLPCRCKPSEAKPGQTTTSRSGQYDESLLLKSSLNTVALNLPKHPKPR